MTTTLLSTPLSPRDRQRVAVASDELCDSIQEAVATGQSTFHVTHNYLIRAIPDSIKSLKPCLQILHIDNCFELTDLPASIGDLSQLRWLNVGYNKLSTLPREIGRLRHLERLHVNNNRLVSLPIEMWALRGLQELHAETNLIRALPSGLLFLTELREVFVEGNPLVTESDVAGADILEVFGVPELGGDCANCRVRFDKPVASCTFHSLCGSVTPLPFLHYTQSESCRDQLMTRLAARDAELLAKTKSESPRGLLIAA